MIDKKLEKERDMHLFGSEDHALASFTTPTFLSKRYHICFFSENFLLPRMLLHQAKLTKARFILGLLALILGG